MARPPLEIAKTAQELFKPFEICQKEYRKAQELEEKLVNQDINISVIGQFKRGKSTLVNAILEEDVMPVGIVPVTAVVTEIKYGENKAEVHFQNGIVKPVDFSGLHEYINEQENLDNKLGVSSVTMFTPAEFLKTGITFVDTPGVGSIHKKNTDAANAFVKESDAVIFMLSVDSPINQIEIEFLKNARGYASKFYFVVNKIDAISKEDLDMYMEYCRSKLCELMEVDEVKLYPVSSITRQGIEELKCVISKDCETSLKDILAKSVRKKLGDLLDGALIQIKLYRNALSMTMEDFQENFDALNECIDQIKTMTQAKEREFTEKANKLKADLEKELIQFKSIPMEQAREIICEVFRKYAISAKTWNFISSSQIDAFVNEAKNTLSAKVQELFGIDYHYDIDALSLDFEGGDEVCVPKTLPDNFDEAKSCLTKEYAQSLEEIEHTMKEKLNEKIQALCQELQGTLNKIFMFREDNAIIVVRRIEDLNKLVRHLRSLRVKV